MRPFVRSAIAESIEAKSRAKEDRACADCGRIFAANVHGSPQVRCPECQKRHVREEQRECQRRLRAKRNADWKAPRKCIVCGKEFIPRNSLQRRCSPECSLRRGPAGKAAKKPSAVKRTKICVVCGKEFAAVGGNRICCSPECSIIRGREKVRAAKRKARNADPRRTGWDADGRHRRFRERAMKAKPWLYEFADGPELLS